MFVKRSEFHRSSIPALLDVRRRGLRLTIGRTTVNGQFRCRLFHTGIVKVEMSESSARFPRVDPVTIDISEGARNEDSTQDRTRKLDRLEAMTMAELHWMPAYELAAMMRRRELKPSELMAATIARIETLNPKFNAFCALRSEAAMSEAKAMDGRLARGDEVGPLAGLPLAVKDLEGVTGMATTFGSVPFKDNQAQEDSIEVARLRAAGAIVIGKTNTPEFGFTAFTRNLLFGVSRNPWNPDRTPGGSSGGSSAAIASGMVPLATASDWGGSIRIPACYTGSFGIKSTQGLIPARARLGMTQWVDFAVVGPITRTVRDAATYLDATVGYHPSDPSSLPRPVHSFVDNLEKLPKRLKVAFHPDFGHPIDSDVRDEVERAAAAFKEMGHELTVLEEPVIETATAWRTIGAFQSLADLGAYIERNESEFGRSFVASVKAAAKITARDYGDAYRIRTQFNEWLRGVFERFDLLLTPTLPTEAFNALGPPPKEIDGTPINDAMQSLIFSYPFNFSGHPAASVRAGFGAHGLPCGLQIVAERHRDDLVMQAAYAYEQARPWNHRWPHV
jgi:aspartyl-tRNA(Asn)/glutamyl-tRNA(Gln) amidotransferase subunit A